MLPILQSSQQLRKNNKYEAYQDWQQQNPLRNVRTETRSCLTDSVNSLRPGGAMVARLTPDQKVACSNHVRVNDFFLALFRFALILDAPFQNCFVGWRTVGAHKLFKRHPSLFTLIRSRVTD